MGAQTLRTAIDLALRVKVQGQSQISLKCYQFWGAT